MSTLITFTFTSMTILCEATTVFLNAQNISGDHPALEILHDLETITYYIDESLSDRLSRHIVQDILRWANMQNCSVKVGAPYILWCHFSDTILMKRMCHLTNKIYREMLCIKRYDRMKYIAMDPAGGLDHSQVDIFSWTPQYRIVLSWDLLALVSVEDRIPRSFINFITTRELSGPLNISPGIYHTQITEYLLEKLYQ